MFRFLLIAFLILPLAVRASDYYETLQADGQVYQQVYVLSANESSLSIRHSRGLSQVSIGALNEELQLKYGYNAAAAAERVENLRELRRQQAMETSARLEKRIRVATIGKGSNGSGGVPDGLRGAFASFGRPPKLESEVDLRMDFRSHGISVRRQRGPSCSVHAIVAALEFQYAEKHGKRVNVSENHLVAATSRTIGRNLKNQLLPGDGEIGVVEDEGFALEQVFQAIRGYGLVLESREGTLSQEEFERAFADVNFSPFLVPGGRSAAGIGNLIHVLNARMPVVVGLSWPYEGSVQRTSLLSKQKPAPGAGHAVTLVGYRCPTGKIEDTKFIFRNSWGMDWGAGGYGFITYEFMMKNLFSGYVVELR